MSEGYKEYIQREQEVIILKLLQDTFKKYYHQMSQTEQNYIEGMLAETGTNSFGKFSHLKKYIVELPDASEACKLFINDVIDGLLSMQNNKIDLGAATNLLKKI